MLRVAIFVGLGAAVCLGLAYWIFAPDRVVVNDVRQSERIVLTGDSGVYTTSLWIRVRGHIDGKADLELILGGQPYQVETLSGDVDFTWSSDWYSDTAEIQYNAAGVRSGSLVVYYHFSP